MGTLKKLTASYQTPKLQQETWRDDCLEKYFVHRCGLSNSTWWKWHPSNISSQGSSKHTIFQKQPRIGIHTTNAWKMKTNSNLDNVVELRNIQCDPAFSVLPNTSWSMPLASSTSTFGSWQVLSKTTVRLSILYNFRDRKKSIEQIKTVTHFEKNKHGKKPSLFFEVTLYCEVLQSPGGN